MELTRNFCTNLENWNYIIHTKWAEIVGSFFVQHSEPRKISSIPQSTDEKGETIYGKYLHVNVTPSAAVEFQHFHNKIVEKNKFIFWLQGNQRNKNSSTINKTRKHSN